MSIIEKDYIELMEIARELNRQLQKQIERQNNRIEIKDKLIERVVDKNDEDAPKEECDSYPDSLPFTKKDRIKKRSRFTKTLPGRSGSLLKYSSVGSTCRTRIRKRGRLLNPRRKPVARQIRYRLHTYTGGFLKTLRQKCKTAKLASLLFKKKAFFKKAFDF